MPDPFVLLGIAAGRDQNIKLITGICLVPEHNPLVLAKVVATVDYFSGGRIHFGIGAGWLADETEIMGVDFRKRWAVTRECIRAMKELWTKPEASFEGKYINFPAVKSFPKPAQKPHPPVLIGANGGAQGPEKVLKDVVTIGDGWMPLRLKAKHTRRQPGDAQEDVPGSGTRFQQDGHHHVPPLRAPRGQSDLRGVRGGGMPSDRGRHRGDVQGPGRAEPQNLGDAKWKTLARKYLI